MQHIQLRFNLMTENEIGRKAALNILVKLTPVSQYYANKRGKNSTFSCAGTEPSSFDRSILSHTPFLLRLKRNELCPKDRYLEIQSNLS